MNPFCLEVFAMQSHESVIKLNDSDHAYVNRLIESGEFSCISDFVVSLIRLHSDGDIDSEEDVEMLREKLERAKRGPFREVTGEQLLQEIHAQAKADGLL